MITSWSLLIFSRLAQIEQNVNIFRLQIIYKAQVARRLTNLWQMRYGDFCDIFVLSKEIYKKRSIQPWVVITMIKRKKGYFSISAVAKMFSVHQQTIRLYEKEGLLNPKRSEGNTRLFSEEDVNRLEEIIYLTHQLGINLAGVEMILKLKKQMGKMQKEMNKIFEVTQKELDDEIIQSKEAVSQNAKQLLKIKKQSTIDAEVAHSGPATKTTLHKPTPDEQSQIFDVDDWVVEYDE